MVKRFATVTQFMVNLCTISAVGCLMLTAAVGRTARSRLHRISGDAGMSTAEYAVGTIAACAFAAVLYQVVTGDSIVSALQDLIDSALSTLS
jgi:hypothetical protein